MDDLRGGVLTLEHRYEVVESTPWDGVGTRYRGVLHPAGLPIDIWTLDVVERLGVPERVAGAVTARLRGLSRQACRLRSPGVVRVIDYGEIDDRTPFQVTDAIRGSRLSEIIAHQGRLPLGGTVQVVQELAEALEEAHALGFGHFAVRPELVWFEETAHGTHARLGCWGQSLLRHELMLVDGARLDGMASWFNHLAPETFSEAASHRWLQSLTMEGGAFDGEWGEEVFAAQDPGPSPGPADPMAFDVFGLAILTCRCLTGEHPFVPDGQEWTLAQQLRALEIGEPRHPSELGVELPAAVWNTLRSGLARDPGARPAGAMAFARKLAEAAGVTGGAVELAPRPALAGPQTVAARRAEVDSPPAARRPAAGEASAPEEPPMAHRAVRYLVAVAVVLLATNLLTLFLLGLEEDTSDVTLLPVPADATWTRVDGGTGVERTGVGGRHLAELPEGRYRLDSDGSHSVEIVVERKGLRMSVKVVMPALSE